MTHPNLQTNGASLEDCHTNFFALTELSGIKWRKLVWSDGSGGGGGSGGAFSNHHHGHQQHHHHHHHHHHQQQHHHHHNTTCTSPQDDPVLRSYARCLAADILCVWRRVAQPPPVVSLFDMGGAGSVVPPTPPPVLPPPLNLSAAKELWIFWYGEEPDLGELVSPELLTPDSDQGSWESGLSYECRSLLFKALHNLIERCLLSRDFIRLGKWFVQPYEAPKKPTETSPTHLSFSFAFFVHGESSVCASVDVRQHPPVRRLARLHLQQAAASATGLQVILAPFGLAGTLTGNTYKPIDATGTHLLDDWAQFYPVHTPTINTTNSPSNNSTSANNNSPSPAIQHPTTAAANDASSSVVEVIVGGVKMRYPAHYVLVTDMDDHVNGGVMLCGNGQTEHKGAKGSCTETATPTLLNTTNQPTTLTASTQHTFSNPTPPPSPPPPAPTPTKVPQPGPFPVSIQHPHSMQRRACVSTALPEAVWQECMLGGPPPTLRDAIDGTGHAGTLTPPHESSGGSAASGGSWHFVDAMKRMQCTCSKCRKSRSGKVRGTSCLSSRIHRIPFHRRSSTPPPTSVANNSNLSTTNTNSSADTTAAVATPGGGERCATLPGGSASTPGYTPHATAPLTPPSYPPRTQESVAVPSVGSPASAAPSPLANPPSQSAPGSVPSQPAPGGAASGTTVAVASSEPTMPTLSPQQPQGGGLNGIAASTPDRQSVLGGATTAPNSTVNSPMPLTSAILGADYKDQNSNQPVIPLVLKRPTLTSKEYETAHGEDEHQLYMLYDYSTLEAWLNHPVKRFKPDIKQHRNLAKNADLYALFTPNGVTGNSELSTLKNGPQGGNGPAQQVVTAMSAATSAPMIPFIKSEIKQEPGLMDIDSEDGAHLAQGVKRPGDPYEFEDEGNNVDGFKRNANGSKEDPKKTGNLFTSEGLQPSYKDLDQIFDHSDTSSDEAISFTQIQTPPGSNKSSTPHHDDSITTIPTVNNKQQRLSGGSNNSTQGSGGGGGGSCTGGTMGGLRPEELSKMFPTPPSIPPIASPCPNTDGAGSEMTDSGGSGGSSSGSGGGKTKQEGTYPNMGSPQEENIEDWSYVFKPPTTYKLVGSSKYAPLTNLPSQSLPPVVLPSECIYKPSWMQQQQLQEKSSKQQQQQQQQQGTNNTSTAAPTVSSSSVATTINVNAVQIGAGVSAALGHNALQQQRGSNNNTPTMLSGVTNTNIPPHHHHSLNNNNVVFPPSPSHTLTQLGFRPPPPPYELPSPANSNTSNSGTGAAPPYILKPNININNPQQSATAQTSPPTPEVNGLLVNVLLADTLLNIFRDHNFDSCTMCVCNAGVREVGDIRGADAGVYLTNSGNSERTFSGNRGINSGGGGLDSPFGQGGGSGAPPPPYGANAGGGHVIAEHSGGNGVGGLEEETNRCSCGFSAVVNRRLSHRSGLFYEDEMQITGIAEDPGERKKSSLASYLLRNNSNATKLEPGLDRDQLDIIPHSIMELLREQCVVIQSSANALHRSIRSNRTSKSKLPAMPYSNTVNALEYNDGNEVTNQALDQSRSLSDSVIKMEDGHHQHHPLQHGGVKIEPGTLTVYGNGANRRNQHPVHRWPFLRASGPQCNQDIVRVMKCLQPLLQEAIQKKCQARLWDAPSAVKGPLTWRQFHRLAGRGTVDRCEPQPIPSLLVGHEKDWLSLSPYALHHWEALLLEPYSYTRDIAYVVVAPDSDAILPRVRSFFRELSTAYEMCRLGRHVPITKVLRDGILRVGKTAKVKLGNEPVEEWFTLLGEGEMMDMLKLYAQVCKHHLAPHLQQVPMDKTLLDPPNEPSDKPAPSPMPPPSTPDNTQGMSDKAPSTPKSDQDGDSKDASSSSFSANGSGLSNGESMHDDDDREPPAVIVYLVDPFSMGANEERPELRRLAYLALLRCFQSLLSALPEGIRTNISVQIISQESLVELGRARERLRHSDHMRSLALSIFSQCRRLLMHTNNVKSLTGFGTAAMADLFLKSKDEKNRLPYKLYTPPYVLAPIKEKAESAESFAQGSAEQTSVLYLSYCLSEDQSWLLAVATDERGEIFETVTINVDIPNRSRRRKASARRIGLQKLMDFILGVMSQSVRPWRLVVGRVGRIGHGELKGWSWLLSRKYLLKASKHLKELCSQCSLIYPASVPCILSACLVSLEPDSQLRLMPDQFTPDERFSLFSVNSQLATPQDLTCTHILVFPTSATTQSSQSAFHDTHINQDLGDDGLFTMEDMPEGMEEINDLNDIFDWDVNCGGQSPTGSPRPEESRPGSPGCHNSATGRPGSPSFSNTPGVGGAFANSASHRNEPAEEVGTLLQQPLALGYYVSTAPTGQMPRWFWASCPHLEHVCPSFLKNALHMHSPNVQQNSDDLLLQQAAVLSHPLDSQYTTDVLRYVLEGYNALSWLALDSNTRDRLSCLPVHIQVLTQLYHTTATLL